MLVTRLVCLSGYLLLTLGLLPVLLVPFEQVVWAGENAAVLSSPRTAWKEVDLAYERLFPYDHARQPHPPVGCIVLPAISHNIYQQGTGITTRPAILMLRCRERINLLSPVQWARSRLHAQNRQGYLLLSIPEMGIMNVQVHMIAIKSSAFNPATMAMKSASSRPVIGLFIHHTTNVRQYTFKDTLTGNVDKIKATPNHPFYVVNQQRYIPVSSLSTHDQLINVLGHAIILVCPKGKTSHCGRPYHPGQVIRVYNLEVYGQHRYFVGKSGIMVHNGYKYKCRFCQRKFEYPSKYKDHLRAHSRDKPYKCALCNRTYKVIYSLRRHLKDDHFIDDHSIDDHVIYNDLGKKPVVFMPDTYDSRLTKQGSLNEHFSTRPHISNNVPEPETPDVTETSSVASGSSEMPEQARARSRSPIQTNILEEDDPSLVAIQKGLRFLNELEDSTGL